MLQATCVRRRSALPVSSLPFPRLKRHDHGSSAYFHFPVSAVDCSRLRRLCGVGCLAGETAGLEGSLIARVDARVHAEAVIAPSQPDWPSVSEDSHEYLHVSVSGQYRPGAVALVSAATQAGQGYWVMAPLQRADGSWVYVNQGFVPQKKRPSRAAIRRLSRSPSPGCYVSAIPAEVCGTMCRPRIAGTHGMCRPWQSSRGCRRWRRISWMRKPPAANCRWAGLPSFSSAIIIASTPSPGLPWPSACCWLLGWCCGIHAER